MTEIDDGIELYRRQLLAEAELARDDIAEIEDHLRMLATDLASAGMSAAEAVAEAARRLGEPRSIAREHARVRSPFGARISDARTWSAIALLSPFLYLTFTYAMANGLASQGGLGLVLTIAVITALAARLPWARALVLGTLGVGVLWDVAALAVGAGLPITIVHLVCCGGAMAFLVPWRRRELSSGALALALIGPGYSAAMTLMNFAPVDRQGSVVGDPASTLAMLCVLAAGAGGLLRARWAVIPAALGTVTLMWGACELAPPAMPEAWQALLFASIFGGAGAMAASGGLLWREAGSTLGTLRGVQARGA